MIALLGGLSNAVRGGQWKEWLGLPEDSVWSKVPSDAINAAIYTITIGILTENIALAALSFIAMWIAMAPGWGDYIGALGGWRKDSLQENKIIDFIISSTKPSPMLWGYLGLTIRGGYCGLCLSLPFFVYSYNGFWLILAGLTMPLCYWLAIKWSKHRAKGSWQSAGWGLGEIFFGLILWSAVKKLINIKKVLDK